jgi:hypothetical protein
MEMMDDITLRNELDKIIKFSRVKIYFDSLKLPLGYVFDLFERKDNGTIILNKESESCFEKVSDPKNADFIFIPVPLSELNGTQEGMDIIAFHREISILFHKPLLLVSDADLLFDPGFKDVILLTPGAYKSMGNQVSLPALLPNDPLEKWFHGEFKIIEKFDRVSVGFCGQATSNFLKTVKDHLQYLGLNAMKVIGRSRYLHIPYFMAASERAALLSSLENSNLVQTDFLKRERYKGGAKSDQDQKRLEYEFFKNIYDNLFTICMRGFGNYSVRFFQTLAMGRIPVVIETDSILPFESQIDYREICVVVPYKDRFKADQYIINFINSYSESELKVIQKRCRQTWLDHFRKKGLIYGLSQELKNMTFYQN